MSEHATNQAAGMPGAVRVGVEEAAKILGLSENAIRKRIERGTLNSEKIDGVRYVVFEDDMPQHADDMPTDMSGDMPLIVTRLENEVEWLRREVERKDTIIMSLSQSIAALEAPREQQESPLSASENEERVGVTPDEEKRSWWQRLFG